MNTPIAAPSTGSTHVHPGEAPHRGADDDGDGAERVREHLEVRALEVEALLRAGAQQEERDQVDGQPDAADDEDGQRRDLGRVADAAERFDEHPAGDAEQQHRVGERGEDLEPVQAERALRMFTRGRRGLDRGERHAQAERVGCHVTRRPTATRANP